MGTMKPFEDPAKNKSWVEQQLKDQRFLLKTRRIAGRKEPQPEKESEWIQRALDAEAKLTEAESRIAALEAMYESLAKWTPVRRTVEVTATATVYTEFYL